MARPRLRDLGVEVGALPPGPLNAITDVSGVLVGHTTVVADEPSVVRTGVTVILPRDGDIWHDHAPAGFFSFNGFGEMTGMHWVDEVGLLGTPIAITNTFSVGTAYEALFARTGELRLTDGAMPVVAETYDGFLSDVAAFAVTREHVLQALGAARGGPVPEGCVGGGTGMICHGFKGGIGTASRVATVPAGRYTVGVLVQANYGRRPHLRVDGVPVGRLIGADVVPLPGQAERTGEGGSIIVVAATDAPLTGTQCRRLAKRATVGLARAGGVGYDSSGDLFLAFSTGNHVEAGREQPHRLDMLPNGQMNLLFDAVAEATEEAIANALVAAETTVGYRGRVAYALPHDSLTAAMRARERR